MKATLFTLTLLLFTSMLSAQQRIEMPLWPNGTPNGNGLTANDENGDANFLNLVANT